ncbi:hypothetical protein JD844_014400, partial [Phrynosoma platyrhinos]
RPQQAPEPEKIDAVNAKISRELHIIPPPLASRLIHLLPGREAKEGVSRAGKKKFEPCGSPSSRRAAILGVRPSLRFAGSRPPFSRRKALPRRLCWSHVGGERGARLGRGAEDTHEMEDKVISPEKAEEAKLKARYPHLGQKPGGSDFLRKRLQKGQKYFDSGDYNMAKAKMKNKQLPTAAPDKTEVTGDHIPTPQDLPQRKPSLVASKLAG